MEEKAFIAQVNQCKGLILKLIGLYAYSIEDRNDMYQEILLNAWRSVKSFRQQSKFSTWLYQVALNTILSVNRKKKPVSYHESLEQFNVAVNPQSEAKEDIQRLYLAIRRLAEIDRVLITLHLEGYDNLEIAGILGIKPNHVGVKLFRVKNQLQLFLKPL